MPEQARTRVTGVHRTVAALVALVAAFPLAAGQAPGQGPLSGEQVRSLIVGNTVIGPLRGQLYDFSFTADGAMVGAAGSGTDSGHWRIRDDNVYCHEWSTLFGGYERCYQWYDTGKGRYTLKNVDAFKVRDLDVWEIRPGLD